MSCAPPPEDLDELLERARSLVGLTVGQLAARLGETLLDDPVRTKGKVGELVEKALGASAGSRDQPDFPHLGVELKTIPLSRDGRPRESTFVCALDLDRAQEEEWETSRAWRKLQRVLWIPVESSATGPLAERRLGRPLLWTPTRAQQELLRADWELIVGRIAVGGVEEVSAHLGEALQARPKAPSSSVKVELIGAEGERLRTVPLGLYLRARFTEALVWELTGAAADA